MKTPDEAIELIRSFEGWLRKLSDGRAAPYLCPARVPTIGWGTVIYADGKKVTMRDAPITREEGERHFRREIAEKEAAVANMVAGLPIHPLMFGALVSFAYNCGTGALRGSTLLRRVKAQQWDLVPGEFAKWRMGGGRILPGLVRRRRAEANMFMRGVRALSTTQSRPIAEPAALEPQLPPTPSWWSRLLKSIWG